MSNVSRIYGSSRNSQPYLILNSVETEVSGNLSVLQNLDVCGSIILNNRDLSSTLDSLVVDLTLGQDVSFTNVDISGFLNLTNELKINGGSGGAYKLLMYNGANVAPKWEYSSLINLSDTTISNPVNNHALVYNGSKWTNQLLTNSLTNLSDTQIGSLTDGEQLTWDSNTNKWINKAGGAQGLNITATSVAIGSYAGTNAQSTYSVAIGHYAGYGAQQQYSVSIGTETGFTNQGSGSVAIGYNAGASYQAAHAVAIGDHTGRNDQEEYAIAIGYNAGKFKQGLNCIAIGNDAGAGRLPDPDYPNDVYEQAQYSIAIGERAGHYTQGEYSIAIGSKAGQYDQPPHSILIGKNAVHPNGNGYFFAIPNGYGFYAGNSNITSDDRLKHNESPILNSISTIKKINPVVYKKCRKMFNTIDDDNTPERDSSGNIIYLTEDKIGSKGKDWYYEAGYIAQDVYSIHELKEYVNVGDATNAWFINYESINAYHLASTKELITKVETLESENAILKTKLNEVLKSLGKDVIK